MNSVADIGLIGLAVMGKSLILNIESRGYCVSCFNRTVSKIDDFLANEAKNKNILGSHSLEEFVSSIKRPRKVMIMVRAGKAVDSVIDALIPLLEEGDVIIDGGNSKYQDTVRREKNLSKKGLLFVGAGVSGGEEGALHGPSIMPGGESKAWPEIKEIFQAISAKVDGNVPCCEWMGTGGAGHFVKMVHNGIEYGDMQLICEAYHLMSSVLKMSAEDIGKVLKEWNEGDLKSYLIEITSEILQKKDEVSGQPAIDVILDLAGQKGTGKWTSQTGLELGIPIPQIAEAVFARCLSSIKDERVAASKILRGPSINFDMAEKKVLLEDLKKAVYVSKISSYAQGFQLLRAASREFNWSLNYGNIASVWRGGCIIRAQFLNKIKDAYDKEPELANILLNDYFREIMNAFQDSLRRIVKYAVDFGIPVPTISSALSYYDAYRCERLPANLLQAQRDYFGAHMYERTDKPRGEYFHTDWTGEGGNTYSSTYKV